MNPTQVKCPHCLASIGQPCTIPGSQDKLALSPAHPSRLELVGLRPAYGVVDRYRDMFNPRDAHE